MRAVLAALLLAGCSSAVPGSPVPAESSDQVLVAEYFAALDKSGEQGAEKQLDFLRKTQHPDFTDRLCDLQGVTITVEPTMSTLRLDPKWAPENGSRPRGEVYVVAVSLTVHKDGQVLGDQIGSQRVVVLDGTVYGFMPCFRQN